MPPQPARTARSASHPALRRLVALGVAAAVLGGCLSMTTRRSKVAGGDEGGGVTLRIYADDDARRADLAGPPGIASQLVCWDGKAWTPTFRSLQPSWTVTGLPEGRCRVELPGRFDASGELQPVDEGAQNVRVREGEIAEVEATLHHVSKPAIVAGVAAGVVAAVLLHDWIGDDLPTPPLPDIPPPWWIADIALSVAIDLALANEGPAGPYGPGPFVSGHFPADGETVEPGAMRIVFSLGRPVELARLDSGGVTVRAGTGETVSGYLQYDAERWWLVWQSDVELPPGGTYHVDLAADAVVDVAGRTLPRPVAFTFYTQ